jgi:GLPGLI family protein
MKNRILALMLLLSPAANMFAQSAEGVIIYEQKINMHRRIQDEAMKAMVPEFRTVKMQLSIKGPESLYKSFEEADDESTSENDGRTVRMVFRAPQNEVYRHFDNKTLVELRELAGKKFLIQDSLKRMAWKLNPTITRKINGYECVQATTTQKETGGAVIRINNGGPAGNGPATPPEPKDVKVVAWFTQDIPSPAGPGNYGGLPGLVMEVDINEGETVISAAKVELKKVTDLKLPSGGKRVTEAEFKKIRDDYMKEVNSQGGGMRVIRN